MDKIVSIICPIRNEEKYIGACLQSLVEQSFDADKIEILVVDGMSDDRTREIAHEFQAEYPNIKLIDNPKRIVPAALNLGISQAVGKYILRMDGHAKAAPDYVEQCVKALESNSVDGVGGPIISVNDSETGKAIALAMSSPFGVGNSRFRTSDDQECFVDSVAFPGYKKEIFDKVGRFDEELVRCQDDEFNFRIRHFEGKILLTPGIKSWYYPRSGFKKLWKQYFGYGFWKVRILQKHFWMMRIRHFVPAAFVISLLFSLVLGSFVPLGLWLFATMLGVYLITSATAALITKKRNRSVAFGKILLSFYILHFAYGTGFLCGLLRFAPRWFTAESSPRAPTHA